MLKLFFVTIVWGIGFPAMKLITEDVPTFYQIGFRFLIASLTLLLVFHGRLRELNRKIWGKSIFLAFLLFTAYIFGTMGVEYTTGARASFFCCLSVILIPFLNRLYFKEKIGRQKFLAAFACFIGVFVLSYSPELGLNFNLGDILCLLCSVCTTSHIVWTEKLVKDTDPALMTFIQMCFISLFGFMGAWSLETYPKVISTQSMLALLFLGILGTAMGFYLQTHSQQSIESVKVGMVFALEPVNGAIASYFILGEHLGLQILFGGAIIFGSIVYSEWATAKKKS